MKILLLKLWILWFLPGTWGDNLEIAKDDAQKNHKLIILYFSGSDWCGPCIKLKQEVLESETFQEFAKDHLSLVRADFPRMKKNQLSKLQTEYNEKLAEKYNPSGKFPLTVLLSPEGKILKEWDGYPKSMNTEVLINQIKGYL